MPKIKMNVLEQVRELSDTFSRGLAPVQEQVQELSDTFHRGIAPKVVNGCRMLYEKTGDWRWALVAREVVRANKLAPQDWIEEYLDGVGRRGTTLRTKERGPHASETLGKSGFKDLWWKLNVAVVVHERISQLERKHKYSRVKSLAYIEVADDFGLSKDQVRNYYEEFQDILEVPI